jgi:hypothetical protein
MLSSKSGDAKCMIGIGYCVQTGSVIAAMRVIRWSTGDFAEYSIWRKPSACGYVRGSGLGLKSTVACCQRLRDVEMLTDLIRV